jgi:hypothetical protein
MSRSSILFSILFLLITVPLLAQEEHVHPMTPPPPVNDEFFNWMLGEWKGNTTSPNGNTSDYLKCHMDLDGQFLVMNYQAEFEGKALMSGIGMLTLDKEGNETGYWFDSWRTMAMGHGSRMGNISTVKWTMHEGVYVRSTEKVDENTMKVTGLMTMPDGNEMKSESLLKRIKK